MASIHLVVKPYASDILNVFDGLILQLMSFIVSVFDFDDPSAVTEVVYVIVIMPVILFCTMKLFGYRVQINNIVMKVICRNSKSNFNINETDVPINNFDLVIEDTYYRRARGITICDM